MMNTPDLESVVQKVQNALAPHPIETQVLALKALLQIETDPQTRAQLERGYGKNSTPADLENAKAEIERAMAGLQPEARDRVALKIAQQYRAEVARMSDRVTADKLNVEGNKQFFAALEALNAWQAKAVLERNDCSRLHKLKEAMSSGLVIDGANENAPADLSVGVLTLTHTFVIQHNWAAAFEGAEGIDDDAYRLPYDHCAFEFRVGGRTVILAAAQTDDSQRFTAFIEAGECWYSPPKVYNLTAWLWMQVRAICIALDADVATETVIRAPAKLNEKRAKVGKVQLSDHHVVDLAKRHRVENPLANAGSGARKRLHFRRGHWRHYENSKTWIRWCLVGNPDLGFIQKSYSL